MACCWNCHREYTPNHECWVCGQKGSTNTHPHDENMVARNNDIPGSCSCPKIQSPAGDTRSERPTPSHTPATGNSARPSTDIVENQMPVLPHSFTGTPNASVHRIDDAMDLLSTASQRYASSICDFDFTSDGGPVVSVVRTSGMGYSSTDQINPDFGSIEIIPRESLPPREKELSNETKPGPGPAKIDVRGWRRGLLVASVLAGMFLGFLDTTIVSVALPTIASDFGDYGRSTWVVTAYLLTYMGECSNLSSNIICRMLTIQPSAFAIIISRLSDIFGRQVVEITSFIVFMITSLGCAVSQSMVGLYVILSSTMVP